MRSPLELRRFEDSVITINRNDDSNRQSTQTCAHRARWVPFDAVGRVSFPRYRETMDSFYRPYLIRTRQARVHALHTLTRRQIKHFLRVYNYSYTFRVNPHDMPGLT